MTGLRIVAGCAASLVWIAGLAGCATPPAHPAASPGSNTPDLRCPARAPSPGLVSGTGSAARSTSARSRSGRATRGRIPVGALTAVICQYDPGLPASKARGAPAPKVALHGAAAAGLAAVLASATPIPAHARLCRAASAALPFSQIAVLGYRGRRSISVGVVYECARAIVSVGEHRAELSGQVMDDLFGYTMLSRHNSGARVPSLIGLRPGAALALARRDDFTISVDGSATDVAAPFGTVIFQVLPPGARVDGLSRQIGVVVAVAPEPPCRASQLTVTYRGAQPGAGNDLGSMVVADRSHWPCRLTGPLHVVGVNGAGHPVTSNLTYPVAQQAVLSPGAPAIASQESLATSLAGWILLAAEYRDDPSAPNGLCTAHYVIPATWRITLPGGVLSVRNAVPRDRIPAGLGSRTWSPHLAMVTCRGRMGTPSLVTIGSPP
jgi:hypothetical protein